MKRDNLILTVVILVIFLPLWMWMAWFLTPRTKLVIAIVDKTVISPDGQEHVSLNWILNHNKLTKTSSERYTINKDYFGFLPLKDEKFKLKGLERFSSAQLMQLSIDADAAYFADTYGIYKNEWYSQKENTERSGKLYGGMSNQDLEFLQNMKARHKLIITEFNTIGSPTIPTVRNQFEKLFAMRWSGWTARYFDSFDTTVNKELPTWLINNYKAEHGNKWPFRKSGIAFVSNDDRVVILEDGIHLKDPMPHILTPKYGQDQFSLPARIKYPFWFDIIVPDLSVNQAISRFDISINSNGAAELEKYGIPSTFPAILMHKGTDYQFYYFSGDFCDNPLNLTGSYFKGISLFKWLFYDSNDPSERASFFWNFYRPLMTNILNDKASEKK